MSKDKVVIDLQQVKDKRRKIDEIEQLQKVVDELKKNSSNCKKQLLKYIRAVDDEYFLEVLIVEAETRKRQLKPGFQSETPRG